MIGIGLRNSFVLRKRLAIASGNVVLIAQMNANRRVMRILGQPFLEFRLAGLSARKHAQDMLANEQSPARSDRICDIVRFARSAEIPVSTRGSVANSLVAYCVGITTVDPIEHDLLFERFLNPARSSLPDIDLDFCSIRRDEVLEYVRRTYGAERVALVATISTLRLRSALRETAKALSLIHI